MPSYRRSEGCFSTLQATNPFSKFRRTTFVFTKYVQTLISFTTKKWSFFHWHSLLFLLQRREEGEEKKEVKTSVCNFISSGFCVFIQQEKHMLSAKIILHSFAVLWNPSLKIRHNWFTVTNFSSIKGCLCQPSSHWVTILFFWQDGYTYY